MSWSPTSRPLTYRSKKPRPQTWAVARLTFFSARNSRRSIRAGRRRCSCSPPWRTPHGPISYAVFCFKKKKPHHSVHPPVPHCALAVCVVVGGGARVEGAAPDEPDGAGKDEEPHAAKGGGRPPPLLPGQQLAPPAPGGHTPLLLPAPLEAPPRP